MKRVPQFMASVLGRHRLSFVFAFFFLSIEAVADLMQPKLLGHLVNEGILARNESVILGWSVAMFAFVALGAIAALSRNSLASRVSQTVGGALRRVFYTRVVHSPYRIVKEMDASTLVNRLTYDITQVQTMVNGSMRIFMKAPLLCLGSLILAFLTSPILSIFLVLIFPVVLLFVIGQLRITLPLIKSTQILLDEMNARVNQFVAGIRVIKAFVQERTMTDSFVELETRYTVLSTRLRRIQALFTPALTLTVSLGICGVLFYSGTKNVEHFPHLGETMTFVHYLTQILYSLMAISNLLETFAKAKSSTQRLAEVLARCNESARTESVVFHETIGPVLKVDSLTVGFGGVPILKNVSFLVMRAQRVGIVGSTGSGKTTLLRVLLGLLPAQNGSVSHAFANKSPPCAYVAQKPFLINATIAENLRLASPDASDDRLAEALRICGLEDVVGQWPDGLMTLVGPQGGTLSGGQRQRLTIARALLQEAPLLLLDDAFSSLDSVTERRVLENILLNDPNVSIVQVSQKISSVVGCSSIVVLDGGIAVGVGPHHELIRTCHVYRQIATSQGWNVE